jgi:hypothetical protein
VIIKAWRQEPTRDVRFDQRRKYQSLNHEHDDAALGEHHADLIGIHAEGLLAAQRQADLEGPDCQSTDECDCLET